MYFQYTVSQSENVLMESSGFNKNFPTTLERSKAMSVERMTFLNITGPISELDSFVYNAVIPHKVQLVKAMTILDSVKGVFPYTEENPYEPILRQMESMGVKHNRDEVLIESMSKSIDLVSIHKRLDYFEEEIGSIRDERDAHIAERKKKENIRVQIVPLKNLDIEVDKFFDFEHMKFRFGKMPIDSFNKLQNYVDKVDIIYFEVNKEDEDIYLMYFTPGIHQETNDSLFASLQFKRIRISEEVKGYPKEALKQVEDEIALLDDDIKKADERLTAYYIQNREELSELYSTIENLNQVFEVRSYAAHSKEAFYLTGWIPLSDLAAFDEEISKLHAITHLVEQDDAVKKSKPPTKLKNNRFFKPFEFLVSMYGMPSYNEIDPTVFVGITYLIMFALMFGDIGQGFVIALAGGLIYHKTKNNLAKLGIYLGVVSMLTGSIYGSVFGNEAWLHELTGIHFLNAMDPKNMGIVLGGTVGFGVLLLVIAMVFNVINAFKSRRFGRLLFDKNGLIGMIFYFAILSVSIAVLFSGEGESPNILPGIIIIIASLVVIFMSHPLQNLVDKKKKIFPEDKGGFFIESAFEIVEVVLSVLSNTISFVRIGAFAMNHVGFSLAIQGLSKMVAKSSSGSDNIFGAVMVMVIGNILIIGLEGMIVAIQCMRLEYYELFSRFFEGEGVLYEPFSIKSTQEINIKQS